MHANTGKKHFSKAVHCQLAKSYCRKDLSFVTKAMTEMAQNFVSYTSLGSH